MAPLFLFQQDHMDEFDEAYLKGNPWVPSLSELYGMLTAVIAVAAWLT